MSTEAAPRRSLPEAFTNPSQSFSPETIIKKLYLQKGRTIKLVKRMLVKNNRSQIGIGQTFSGVLDQDVKLGLPIRIVNRRGNTSAVNKIYKFGSSYFIQTDTSVYEIIPEFEGLSLRNELGEINLPKDAKSAELGNEVISLLRIDEKGGQKYRVYINKPVLNDILLEVHGGNLFRAINGRFIVIVKVNNIHLPFYISSKGTSGKKKGEWYPFFGYNDEWLIKGKVVENGVMRYHPEISRIQELLNKNFVIPIDYISSNGKFISKTGRESTRESLDLNKYFKYQEFSSTEYKHDEQGFIEHITGYKPRKVFHGDSSSSKKWIKSITGSINA